MVPGLGESGGLNSRRARRTARDGAGEAPPRVAADDPHLPDGPFRDCPTLARPRSGFCLPQSSRSWPPGPDHEPSFTRRSKFLPRCRTNGRSSPANLSLGLARLGHKRKSAACSESSRPTRCPVAFLFGDRAGRASRSARSSHAIFWSRMIT